ncbi:unnamed protein product [Lasius platythorax]|uniref:Uncharacterized protein n=1 Tax=Lasius platythorax TaxID=488582 RepID=A0AAV2N023_9HYME
MKSWIYDLSKCSIAAFAANHGIYASGPLEDIRRRVRTYLDSHPEITADAEPTAMAGTSAETFADARKNPRTPVILAIPVPQFRLTTGPGLDESDQSNAEMGMSI